MVVFVCPSTRPEDRPGLTGPGGEGERSPAASQCCRARDMKRREPSQVSGQGRPPHPMATLAGLHFLSNNTITNYKRLPWSFSMPASRDLISLSSLSSSLLVMVSHALGGGGAVYVRTFTTARRVRRQVRSSWKLDTVNAVAHHTQTQIPGYTRFRPTTHNSTLRIMPAAPAELGLTEAHDELMQRMHEEVQEDVLRELATQDIKRRANEKQQQRVRASAVKSVMPLVIRELCAAGKYFSPSPISLGICRARCAA